MLTEGTEQEAARKAHGEEGQQGSCSSVSLSLMPWSDSHLQSFPRNFGRWLIDWQDSIAVMCKVGSLGSLWSKAEAPTWIPICYIFSMRVDTAAK